MKYRKICTLVLFVFMIFGLGKSTQGNTEQTTDDLKSGLIPMWATGIISEGFRISNLIITDLNQDETPDLVACMRGSVYVLNQTSDDSYDTVWYSRRLGCDSIVVGDRDRDGTQEIYTVSSHPLSPTRDSMINVHVFHGNSFEEIDNLSFVSSGQLADIGIADVDSDSGDELVIVLTDKTLIYDINTWQLEWDVEGKGGRGLGIGDIDGDSELEIVVNGNPAHILNASLKEEEWDYSDGFGNGMAIGDLDGDNVAEIAYIENRNRFHVFDAKTLTTTWEMAYTGYVNLVTLADMDGDSINEILLTGDSGSPTVYRGNDGTKLGAIPNPERNISGLGVGDMNNDGNLEVVWRSGDGIMFVGDWATQSVVWMSQDLNGPLRVLASDVDDDNQIEIVMVSRSSNERRGGGVIRVYDGATYQLEWSIVTSDRSYEIHQVSIGQLDSDPAQEIIIGGKEFNNTRLRVYDGKTTELEWESEASASDQPRALHIMNLDDDPIEEIVLGLGNRSIQIFNGASSNIQWESPPLEGYIQDVDIRDLDGDSTLDMAVLTTENVYIFEVGTWEQKLQRPFEDGGRLAIANGDLSGAGELLISTRNDLQNVMNHLEAWDGTTYELLWQKSLGAVFINDIMAADIDRDGHEEFMLAGSPKSIRYESSFLQIGSQSFADYWVEYQDEDHWGTIQNMALADVNNDGQNELLLSSDSLIQVSQFVSSPLIIKTMHLPIVRDSEPPPSLFYPQDNKCAISPILEGQIDATLQFCVEQVEVLPNTTVKFHTSWTVTILDEDPNCIQKHSDEGNTNMYITDSSANRYDHFAVGNGAFGAYICNSEPQRGWFHFAGIPSGPNNFTFHNEDQSMRIEGIIIE